MSGILDYIAFALIGFLIGLFLACCSKTNNEYDRYERGFYDGYRSAQEDMNGKNRKSNGSEPGNGR